MQLRPTFLGSECRIEAEGPAARPEVAAVVDLEGRPRPDPDLDSAGPPAVAGSWPPSVSARGPGSPCGRSSPAATRTSPETRVGAH